MRQFIRIPTSLALGCLLCSSGWAEQLADTQALDPAAANAFADRCFSQSKAHGWPPFSIAVVDPSGSLLSFRRQIGASSITAEAALIKARTSARAGAATGALSTLAQDPAARDLLILLQLTTDPGGLPLKRSGRLIAAIGVSGGSAEQDVGCAAVIAAAVGE